MIPDRLKKIIFRKLYDDLSHVEIISFRNSIWFIDREEKYWYFELQSDGTLWWRYQFFSDFFILFSLERDDYQSILARWVEEVLNSRVYRTSRSDWDRYSKGDSRVYTTGHTLSEGFGRVEEVLNSRVNTTTRRDGFGFPMVEEVLNSKVSKTKEGELKDETIVDTILSSLRSF